MTVGFDSTAMTGVGSYTIDPAASRGSLDTGNLFVSFMEYDRDPLSGGMDVTADIELSAAASVLVTAPATVPEPRTAIPLGLAILLDAWFIRRCRPVA